MSERKDGDRIVVTGYSAGSHFPRTQAQTQYRFEADGNSAEGPFFIDGSVYGRDIRMRGPGTVLGPLLGRGDITLQNHSASTQRLLGGLHGSGNASCISRGAKLRDSLVGSVEAADYAVRGDVIAEHVSLENAVVFGNVRGRQVRLAQCIVFGQVIAKESAIVSASTLLSYFAPSVRFEGPCCLLFSSGVSERAPEFAPFKDGAHQSWDCDLRYFPALRTMGFAGVAYRPWDEAAKRTEARLYPEDWVKVDVEQEVSKIRDGRLVVERLPAERYVLSIAGRALNFEHVQKTLDHLSWMLQTILEFDHYHPNAQQAVHARWKESCTADELFLLGLGTAPPRPQAPVETVAQVPRLARPVPQQPVRTAAAPVGPATTGAGSAQKTP